MKSEIKTCTDCGEPFCAGCNDEFTHCPDCGDALCDECSEFSLEQRMSRCVNCWHEDITRVRYSNTDDAFKLKKLYTAPHTGRLRD